MLQKIFFAIIIMFIRFTSFSQPLYDHSDEYHNSIYIEITPNPFFGFISINYERKIIQLNKNRISAQVGYGYWQ